MKTYDKLERMISWICVIPLSIIFVKAVQGEVTEFVTTNMTWLDGFDYCVEANRRLIYVMSDFSTLETERLLYLKQISASLDVSELYFWTIHRVNNQTTRGERFYTEAPVENFMYDNEFLLCVYYVYERNNNRLGWEADNCSEKEQYVICSDRVSSFHLYDDFMEITQYDENVVLNETKRYCDHENNTMIDPAGFPVFELTFLFLWRELNIAGNTLLANTPWKGLKFLKVVQGIVPGIGDDYDCEYAESKYAFTMKWSMKSCREPLQGFMCENISEKIIFFEIWNYMITNKIKLIMKLGKKAYECEDICLWLRTYGIYCVGFTYYRAFQECMLLGQSSSPSTRPYYHFEKAEGVSAYIILFGKVQIGDFKQFFELDTLTDIDTTEVKNNWKKGDQNGQIYTITVGVLGVMASVVILYHAAPIMQGLRKRASKTTAESITQKEVEDHVSDAVEIPMSDIDAEKLFAKRIEIWSVPPISHIDVISK